MTHVVGEVLDWQPRSLGYGNTASSRQSAGSGAAERACLVPKVPRSEHQDLLRDDLSSPGTEFVTRLCHLVTCATVRLIGSTIEAELGRGRTMDPRHNDQQFACLPHRDDNAA